MKLTKKLASLALALLMICALSTNVFAAGEGSITINGVSDGNTYEIYKLLDLESYNTTSGAYSYKVNSAWTGFFATAEALEYVAIDDAGYVTWKATEDDDTVAAFAKLALAWAKDKNILPIQSSKPVGDPPEGTGDMVVTDNGSDGKLGKFSNLELGYYLIDSTMGALCGLTTTNPDASINAKNGSPTIDKQVQEDSTNQWAEKNTADIGQTVNFRVTINVHAGAQNYVLHDEMSEGLTFQSVSKIEHIVPGTGTHPVPAEKYTVKTEDLTDDCTFEVQFSEEFCNELETNDKVIVYYSAMVNHSAIIANDGTPNETWLDYGENHHSTHDTTQTYTFGFDIVKTDSQNKLINGAKFKIYDAATDGNTIAVTKQSDGSYLRDPSHDGDGGDTIIVTNGQIRVVGFDNGTYYLEETEAPDGYNKLTARQKFIIADGNLDAVFNDGIFSTGSGVHVVNKTGSMLPETGGIGTTIFYISGAALALGAVVLLITKKRMGAGE